MSARPDTPRRGRVLVVDDHLDGRLVLAEFLTAEGFEAAAAATADAALELLAAEPPDLVVLDLLMPQTGGVQLAAELRRRAPHLPLVAYTGVVDPRLLERARTSGFDRVVTKPDLPGLLDAVAALVRGRPPAAARRGRSARRRSG